MSRAPDSAMPFLLVAAFRGLVDELHERLASSGYVGITARHGFAMQALGSGCSASELAHRLGVSKQAATRTAADLERLGLVERTGDPADARARIVRRTDRGSRMLEESGRILHALVGEWRTEVGDANVEATLHTLSRVDHGSRSATDVSDWA